MNTDPEAKASLGLFQLILAALSVYVLVALFIQAAFTLSPGTNALLDLIDSVICVAFLADFGFRYYLAPSKLKFLKWGWIDLVSSIPMLPVLRIGRLARVIRVLRILSAFRSTKHLVKVLYHNKAKNAFTAVVLITGVLALFSSIAILNLEKAPDSNIKTPADALWWAFVTVSTVGYGDKYPVTNEGRIVAALLMIAGVGLFGTFTAFLAGLFFESKSDNSSLHLQVLTTEIKLLRREVEALKTNRQS